MPIPRLRTLVLPLVLLSASSAAHAVSRFATMGDPLVEYSNDSANSGLLNAFQYPLPQAGTIQSLSLYVVSPFGNVILGIYDDAGGHPGTLRASTAAFPASAGWNGRAVTTPVNLPAGNYWLVFQPSDDRLVTATAVRGGLGWSTPRAYGALPATYPGGSGHYYRTSLFATFSVPDPAFPTFASVPPRPLTIVIDDLGWQGASDLSGQGGPYRLGVSRNPQLADYQTIIDAGKGAGTRIQTVWVLSELDRSRILAQAKYNPTSGNITEKGTSWDNAQYVNNGNFTLMNLARDNAPWMEFGLHGTRHEHWTGNVLTRAEWANSNTGQSWGWGDMDLHAQAFVELMRQYYDRWTSSFPVSFVPCAYVYFYAPGNNQTTGALLHNYGVKYINGGLPSGLDPKAGFDNGALFMNRDPGQGFDVLSAAPDTYTTTAGFQESHLPNWYDRKDEWQSWLAGINNDPGRLLPKNTELAASQWLYRGSTAVSGGAGTYTIDNTRMVDSAYSADALGNLILKTPLAGKHISSASVTNNAQVVGYYEDGYGYGYLVLGHRTNPRGRLDKATYTLTATLGDTYLPTFVDLNGVTFNVYALDATSHTARISLNMYGTQVVRVSLPFSPTNVVSSNPNLVVQSWSYASPYLTMTVAGKNIQGEAGTLYIDGDGPKSTVAYRIVNQNSGKVADVSGASLADGGDIRQWTWNGGAHQQWQFTATDSGYFKIKGLNSGKLMQGVNGSGNVVQFGDDGSASVQWRPVHVGSGWYRLENRAAAKVLDVTAASTADGGDIVEAAGNGSAHQLWRLEEVSPDPSASYLLLNQNSGMATDVSGGSLADGGDVIQWTMHGGPNQRWQLIATDRGYYKVKNVNSGKLLAVDAGSFADGANVFQWTDDGGADQQWFLADVGNGWRELRNRNSSKVLAVQGASTTDGGNIIQSTRAGTTSQRWLLLRAP